MGRADHRAGDEDALLLAAAHAGDVALSREVGEADGVERLERAGLRAHGAE